MRRMSQGAASESCQNLLINNEANTLDANWSPHVSPSTLGHHTSSIYMHYRHSLNSLNDMIDRVRPSHALHVPVY